MPGVDKITEIGPVEAYQLDPIGTFLRVMYKVAIG